MGLVNVSLHSLPSIKKKASHLPPVKEAFGNVVQPVFLKI
jgi:hypothetical protein